MTRLMLLIFLSCISFLASGQFGLSIKYDNNGLTTWNNEYTEGQIKESEWFGSEITVGLDYWFRVKDKRIEFFPEIAYSLKSEVTSADGLDPFSLERSRFGFGINTHFYVLDFGGDCNCPTFSKQGDLIQKGFFLMVNPGIDFNQYKLNGGTENTEVSKHSDIAFRMGLGAGLDIGINDLLTITPFVVMNYYPSLNPESVTALRSALCPFCDLVPTENTRNTQLQIGLRVGFRPDYK